MRHIAVPAFMALLLLGLVIYLPGCSRGGRTGDNPVVEDAGSTIPVSGAHVDIQLRDEDGNAIDIENDSTPYSPKQTCGYCHDYSTIEQGFHFQQGAENLDDDYGDTNNTHDWVLSDGMIGKW
jgi:hypothetical protein